MDTPDEDDFFNDLLPGTSGLTLSLMNNKSSVLCPETQDITSQHLILQQLDAHQRMISRAKGVVDTSPPKSMQSYRSVSSQRKKKMLKYLKDESQIMFHRVESESGNRPSSRLNAYNSEEDDNRSTNTSFVNKAIQAGISVPSNSTCKTAEKISWYLEALSLGELHSQYFTFLDNNSVSSRLTAKNFHSTQGKKRVVKGDILDWHREHFIEPKKAFSPRILADKTAKSKVREMRCYNPPFRKKKASSSHSSDTFESYDEEDNEEESQENDYPKLSDHSSVEEETLINRRPQIDNTPHYNSSIPLLPHYQRSYDNYRDSSVLSQNEEDKYLDFLSKVTEDILRSGVYSDKAIKQAFEFHMQFYSDDSNKEKIQSLLEQVLEGLKVSNDEAGGNLFPKKPILFSMSRPNTPPEKENATFSSNNDSLQTGSEMNSTLNESEEKVDDRDDS